MAFSLKSEAVSGLILKKVSVWIFFLFLAYLQANHVLEIRGVNPNLALAALVALFFFEKNLWVLLLSWASFFFVLEFLPSFSQNWAGLTIILAGAWVVSRKFSKSGWRLEILVLASTAAFYFLTDFYFLISYPAVFLGEAFYNLLAARIIFFLLRSLNF